MRLRYRHPRQPRVRLRHDAVQPPDWKREREIPQLQLHRQPHRHAHAYVRPVHHKRVSAPSRRDGARSVRGRHHARHAYGVVATLVLAQRRRPHLRVRVLRRRNGQQTGTSSARRRRRSSRSGRGIRGAAGAPRTNRSAQPVAQRHAGFALRGHQRGDRRAFTRGVRANRAGSQRRRCRYRANGHAILQRGSDRHHPGNGNHTRQHVQLRGLASARDAQPR